MWEKDKEHARAWYVWGQSAGEKGINVKIWGFLGPKVSKYEVMKHEKKGTRQGVLCLVKKLGLYVID